MKISYNWLKDFLKIDLPHEEAMSLLTDLGLEVEGITVHESIKGSLRGVVVGEVVECRQHPNADRLKVTQVAIAPDVRVQIVCGAPNVAVGQKVPVATIGTTLYPKPDNAFKIKKSKIRGELSEGMICAKDELGLGANHDGIMTLDKSLKVGTLCSTVFNIEKDVVFEIGLTPNRADAMSHYGVARDLKAACIQKKIPFEWNTPKVSSFHADNTTKTIPIEVVASKKAPQYYGLVISNLKIAPSPKWLQNRLEAIGLTPKNNVVDVTNYVLHELGQPLHAFNADKIKDKIIVKTLSEKTRFKTLDGVVRELNAEDLMICDSETPHCIAGVFGGADSGVSDTTTSIFLESAYFDPISIRKTAKQHGLNTDASFRFERGVDPEIGVYALKRAALLIKELTGGQISSEIQKVTTPLPEVPKMLLNFDQIKNTIGQEISNEELNIILNALEIEVNSVLENGIIITVPRYRVDVTRPADVIEEILRIYGYNNLKSTELKFTAQPNYSWKSPEKLENSIAQQLTGKGFYEMINNSLSSPSHNGDKFHAPIEILNPLGQEVSQLRQSLLNSALEVIASNLNRQNKNLKLFEFGKIYGKQGDSFIESKRLSVVIVGSVFAEHWTIDQDVPDFFYLKGIVHQLLDVLGITNYQTLKVNKSWLAEGLGLCQGKNALVNFGLLSKSLLKEFSIEQEVCYAEFNWSHLVNVACRRDVTFSEISKFPSSRRDFALLLDNSVAFSQVKEIALRTEREILKSVELFDVYEGNKLPEGKKSYGVSFIFQDSSKTLTDEKTDEVMEQLKTNFEKELNATLRQ